VFLDWQRSSSSEILLLHGIPGTGKTMLASRVVDLYLADVRTNALSFAYFYCKNASSEPERRDPESILRTILHQLSLSSADATMSVRASVVTEYLRCKKEADFMGFEIARLRTNDCIHMIVEIAVRDPLVIVVDAIDQIESMKRGELLDAFKELVRESSSVIKIFITSRDNNQVFRYCLTAEGFESRQMRPGPT
jgi:Cdc6-like AAA superfamily ATPase